MADRIKQAIMTRRGGADEETQKKAMGAALYFALGFAMSGAKMIGEVSPFGAALVAAAGPGLGGVAALLGACLGYVLLGGLDWGIKYVACCVLIYTASFAFQDLTLSRKPAFMPCITAAIALMTAMLGSISITRQTLPTAARLFLEVVLAGGCAYFFADALSGTERVTERGETRRSIAWVILLACLMMSVSRLTIFGFISIGRIGCNLIVMLSALTAGMFTGCAVGTAMGIAMDAAISMAPFFTMAYALCGVLSGVFSKHGKLVFLLSYIAANTLAVICAWTTGSRIESMYEVFIASVIFLLVPKSTLGKLGILFKSTSMGCGDVGLRRYTAGRIYGMGTAFSSLCDAVKNAAEAESNDNNISTVFDRAADQVCVKCKRKSECWTKHYIDTLNVLNDATANMRTRGKLEEDDLPDYFREQCSHLAAFVSAVNEELRRSAYRNMMKMWLDENTRAVLGQYADFSDILCEVSQEMGGPYGADPLAERRLIRYLNSLDVPADTAVFRDGTGRLRITIESGRLAALTGIPGYLDKLSEVLGVRLCRPEETQSAQGRLLLLEAEPLAVTVGIAAMKKKGEKVNGDKGRYFKTDSGELCVILSDGLGTGPDAAKESTVVVDLLEKFLRSGVSPSAAMKILNSVMLLKNRDEWGYATIDLMCVDLFSGEACFYKYGAAPSYIKTAKGIRKIKCDTLCAGMGTGGQSSPDIVRMMLRPGNIAVIASDGVTAGKTDEEMKELIEANADAEMKDLARQVLLAAQQEDGQSDDMTVLAVRLEARK